MPHGNACLTFIREGMFLYYNTKIRLSTQKHREVSVDSLVFVCYIEYITHFGKGSCGYATR